MLYGSVLNPIPSTDLNNVQSVEYDWSFKEYTASFTIPKGYSHLAIKVVEGNALINNSEFTSQSPGLEIPLTKGQYNREVTIVISNTALVHVLEVRKV